MADDRRTTIVIQDLAEARAALAVAREGGRPLRLITPPGAAAWLGPRYFAELTRAARAEFPDVDARFVLDCGDMAGLALAALSSGVEAIAVEIAAAPRRRIEAMARASGASVEPVDRHRPGPNDPGDLLPDCRE
jgi:hypothetical protein